MAGALALPGSVLAARQRFDLHLEDARARLAARAREARCTLPLRSPAVRVLKARRELMLTSGVTEVAHFPVALGLRPTGHKERAGDRRTPEGRYFICSRNDQSAFHLFMGLSYPNAIDARAAEARLGLDATLVARIARAERERRAPPWNSALGGAIGIHGGGTGADWTFGCVALQNQAIEELWLACPLGTPVLIVP